MTYPLSIDYNTAHGLQKPKLPYFPGNELSVVSHYPPPPTRVRVSLTRKTALERQHVDILTRCLKHPPLDGNLIPEEKFHLKVLDIIRAGDGKSSQLVSVQILSGPKLVVVGLEAVAKFYDPLYYDHTSDDADPFLCVDRDYTHETAAYNHLSGSVNVIPLYYGSYSLEIPVNEHQSRFVRLILIQKISGFSMDMLDPQKFTVGQRKSIMKKVVDAESQLYQRNVRHGDIHPRNVMVQDLNHDNPKVTMVDFGKALIGRSYDPSDPEEEEQYLPGMYITPVLRWALTDDWFSYPCAFKKWITWDWQSWLEDEYKGDEITEHMRSLWSPPGTKPLPPPPD